MIENSLTSFIQIFDNFFGESECKTLIDLFENNKNLHEIYDSSESPIFSRLNLQAHRDKLLEYNQLISFVEKKFEYLSVSYRQRHKDWVPFPKAFEDIRIKKYNNNNKDKFDIHTDSNCPKTCHRYLALMVYLNDVDNGGETEFNFLNLKIKPKMGRALIFPPFWMFPHAGLMPISSPKYLLSTYCSFNHK